MSISIWATNGDDQNNNIKGMGIVTKYKLGDKKINTMHGDWFEILGKVYEPSKDDHWLEIKVECELRKSETITTSGSFVMNPDWFIWGDNKEVWEFVIIQVLDVSEYKIPDKWDLDW